MANAKVTKDTLHFWQSLYDFNTFKKKHNHLDLLIYNAFLIILISVLSALRNVFGTFSSFSPTATFFSTFFGLPILIVLIYVLFYIFLNAFETKRKAFFESYLVFLAITLPFFFIGYILRWVAENTAPLVGAVIGILLTLLVIYYIVNTVINFKRYYGTSAYRVLASFILVDLVFIFLVIMQYMTYMITL